MSRKMVDCVLLVLSLSLIATKLHVNAAMGADIPSAGLYTVAYNPYASIDWNATLQLKTQLHCHTIEGGGGSYPYTVLNDYATAGFNAVGISDYNRLTWPWTQWEEQLSPAALNMVAMPNDEVALSVSHFVAPFLNATLNGTTYGADVQSAINNMTALGGIPVIAHPWLMGFDLTTADSWTGFQGIDIYNPAEGGFHSFDFQFWDHLLTDPARAQKHIWGFAVDDSHSLADIDHGWIVVYSSQKNGTSVRDSIMAGSFIAVVNSTAILNSITQLGNTLTVDTNASVVWKADGQRTVGTNSILDLNTLGPGYTYVRAEIDNSTIFTQPVFITQINPYKIFSNGFENGFASWNNTVTVSGTISQSSMCAYSGLCSAKVTGIQYFGDQAYVNRSLGSDYKRVNVRGYVDFSSVSTSGVMHGPLSFGSSDYYVSSVMRNFTSSKWGVQIFSPEHGEKTFWENGTSVVSTKIWYYVELGTVISTHGFATLWVNGVMRLNATDIDFGASTMTSVNAGEYYTTNDLSQVLTYYIDDIVVSDSYVGPVRYDLTVGVSGHGMTNATGTFTHDAFSNVTVSAIADSGWNLDHWTLNGTVYGAVSLFTVNVSANYDLIAVFSPPSTYLVVRGETDSIFYRGYNPTSKTWENWSVFPEGATSDSPASALVGNMLYVVVRGVNFDQIWFGYANLTDSAFSGWTLLSGATPSTPTLTSNGTTLCLVVRGETNLIWYRFYDLASSVWSDWTSIPDGATYDTPAAALIGNNLQIVVRGVNYDQIWHTYINLTDNSFSGWMLLDGATPSVPMLTSNNLSICLVVRGETDIIWYRFYNAASKVWSDWVSVPDGATPDTPAAVLIGNTLQIVVRGANYDQIWHGYVSLNDSTFSGWSLLDGATPSRPVLAK